MSFRKAFYTILFLLFEIAAVSGEAPYLKILPNEEERILSLGSSFIATCKVFGVEEAHFLDTRLKWLDPNGEEILETPGVGKHVFVMDDVRKSEKKLVLSDIRLVDGGTYTCSALLEGNEQTKAISIVLFQDITFKHAPSPQFVTMHQTELVECKVSGNPSPTVEWIFKGKQIVMDPKYTQEVYGLYIRNVSKEDQGVYTCQASVPSSGRFEAKYIDVIVSEIPKIDKSKSEFEGVQSHEFALHCNATGKPQAKFEFFKDGQRNPVHTTDKQHFDAEGGFLTFRPLTKDAKGTYVCKAFNDAGSDVHKMTLNVVVPPSIYSFQNNTGIENKSYTLACLSEGDPAPNITIKKVSIRALSDPTKYFHMGDNEDGRIHVHMVGNEELRVEFKQLKASDYSNYTCISRNKGGMHERNATITVNFKPQFDPANVRKWYIWPGKTRNLTCMSYAEPMPLIEWIKYKSIRTPIYTNKTFIVHRMGKNSNLQVTVREQDQNWIYGTYYCVVRNNFGSSNLSIELVRAYVPGRPKEAMAREVTADTLILDVVPPEDDGGQEILGYRIDFEFKSLRFNLDEQILIEYLRPSTKFVFRIRAFSEVGEGDFLDLTVQTEDVQKPGKLELEGGEDAGYAYKYVLHWRKPDTGGQPIKQYKFRYRRVKLLKTEGLDRTFKALEGWNEIRKDDVDPEQPMRFYVFNNLKQDSYYEVIVSARNDIGYSDDSEPFVFKTDIDPYYSPSERDDDDNSAHSTHHSYQIILILFLFCLFFYV